MSDLLIVIFFSLIGGVFSLLGGFLLLANTEKAQNLLKYVTPFAAGALLAAAFRDILPEAARVGGIENALTWSLVGIIGFFLMERFLRWFHHHHPHGSHDDSKQAAIPLIVAGDIIHNFLDGIAIAAAFLIDIPTGIVATIAVAAHEIPQEIGDFGLLLDKGMSRAGVVKVNIMSAFATTLSAVLFFQFSKELNLPIEILLGLVAGFFIYIAVSDIIPSIHQAENQRLASIQTVMLVAGVIVVSTMTASLQSFIEPKMEQSSEEAGYGKGTMRINTPNSGS